MTQAQPMLPTLRAGDKIGRLLIVGNAGARVQGGRDKGAKWLIRCDCGYTGKLMTYQVRKRQACRSCLGLRPAGGLS